MCGIAGVVAWDERYRTSRETLARLSAAIAHRGPDGEGTWFNHEGEITPDRPQVAFAHRRLAIIDPDPRANQPFTDGEGHWIVFNGEIYNFRELRKELASIKPDYAWRTDCDTEVLLAAYAAWGVSCFARLTGMFAVAIWDESEKTLFLARDRMGQKPLYVAEGDGRVAFASELGALRAIPWVTHDISPEQLDHYLRWGYTGIESTIYAGVEQLRPGWCHVRTADPQEWEALGYTYAVHPGPPPLRDAAAVAQTRAKVLAAVAGQLVSDVPLGCFLSGGVDSSVVTAAMVHAAGGDGSRVETFSIGFDDPRYDETEHAAAVAAHLGVRHHCFTVKPDAATDLPKLAAVFGEPFADSSALPTHYLSRETRKRVKVALSGDGGDELFGGYDRYRAIRHWKWMRWTPRAGRSLVARWARSALPGGHPKSRRNRAGRLLSAIDQTPGEQYATFIALFPTPLLAELLGREPARDGVSGGFNAMMSRVTHGDPVQAARQVDLVQYLPGDLLTKVDRASMLHALEVRSPFMDHELVDFARQLTTAQLLDGGPKRMLREAFADDLPAWVFKRKKMGFAVPIGDWFRGELRPMLRDHLFATNSFARGHFNMKVVERLVDEHDTKRVDHSQRLYALLMLELWWRLQ